MKTTRLKSVKSEHPRWMIIVYDYSKSRKDYGYGRKVRPYVEVTYFYSYDYAVTYMNYKVAEGCKVTLQALFI